jgi:hypothetical protein
VENDRGGIGGGALDHVIVGITSGFGGAGPESGFGGEGAACAFSGAAALDAPRAGVTGCGLPAGDGLGGPGPP